MNSNIPASVLGRLPDARSLDDLAYEAIKEAIVSCRLASGSPLVETQLAKQLGVSKTPVRSALRRLEAEGHIERVPYGGIYVTEMSLADVQDVFSLRAVLEGLAMRIAADVCTENECEEARSLLLAAQSALDNGELELAKEIGRQWHSLLLTTVSNRFLLGMLDVLKDHIERGRGLTSANLESALKSIEEHHQILDAIEARNGELAEKRVKDHLMRVVRDFEWSGSAAK